MIPLPAASVPGDAAQHGTEACEMCATGPHPKATHCRRCGATWARASKTAHCPTCHRTFSSPSAFDRHLKPAAESGCYRPETVVRRKTGARVFAEPRVNPWGTEVWRQVGSPGWP
jgi:hypothetical protein